MDTEMTKDRPQSYFFAHSNEYILDSFEQGGCSRYINHSSEDPNIEVRTLFTNGGDKRIAFFASKYINAGQEVSDGIRRFVSLTILKHFLSNTNYLSLLTYRVSALL